METVKVPVIQAYEDQLRNKLRTEVTNELKQKFVLERWHCYFIVAFVSTVCSIFSSRLMLVSAFSLICLVVETYIGYKFKKPNGSSSVSVESVISDIEAGELDEK